MLMINLDISFSNGVCNLFPHIIIYHVFRNDSSYSEMTPAIPIRLGDSTISRLRLGRSGLSGQQAGRCGRAQSTHGAQRGVRW